MNAPTVFNVHVKEFIEAVWFALRDQKLQVRERAVEALRACLCVIENRETRWRVQWWYSRKHFPSLLFQNLLHSLHGPVLLIPKCQASSCGYSFMHPFIHSLVTVPMLDYHSISVVDCTGTTVCLRVHKMVLVPRQLWKAFMALFLQLVNYYGENTNLHKLSYIHISWETM